MSQCIIGKNLDKEGIKISFICSTKPITTPGNVTDAVNMRIPRCDLMTIGMQNNQKHINHHWLSESQKDALLHGASVQFFSYLLRNSVVVDNHTIITVGVEPTRLVVLPWTCKELEAQKLDCIDKAGQRIFELMKFEDQIENREAQMDRQK